MRLLFEALNSIVCPKVIEMFLNLNLERLLNWLSIFKPLYRNQKGVQVSSFVYDTHLLGLSLTNSDKVSHNE